MQRTLLLVFNVWLVAATVIAAPDPLAATGVPAVSHAGSVVERRLHDVRQRLWREVDVPSSAIVVKPGYVIDHAHLLSGFATTFACAIGYPNAKRCADVDVGVAWLRSALSCEPRQEAIPCYQVALAKCGDPSCWMSVVAIARNSESPLCREQAVSALGCCRALLAIPDLLRILRHDPYKERKTGGIWPDMDMYCVRIAARFALLGCGVKVTDVKVGEIYEVDETSAVDALQAGLTSASSAEVAPFLRAIAAVGGVAAEDALGRFVRRHEGEAAYSSAIAEARDLLAAAKRSTRGIGVRSQ